MIKKKKNTSDSKGNITKELFQCVVAYKQVYLANSRVLGFLRSPQCPEVEGRSKEVPKMKTSAEGGSVWLSSIGTAGSKPTKS